MGQQYQTFSPFEANAGNVRGSQTTRAFAEADGPRLIRRGQLKARRADGTGRRDEFKNPVPETRAGGRQLEGFEWAIGVEITVTDARP